MSISHFYLWFCFGQVTHHCSVKKCGCDIVKDEFLTTASLGCMWRDRNRARMNPSCSRGKTVNTLEGRELALLVLWLAEHLARTSLAGTEAERFTL